MGAHRHRRRSTEVCFLCLREGADTTEHVVPRCLYPGALPNDVITLPAHGSCNRHTCKDEEAFRNFIAAGIAPENPGHTLWETTWRALHRPDQKRTQAAYYRGILRASYPFTGLRPSIVPIPAERVNRVLAKIVRGLFRHITGDLLPAETWWTFGQGHQGQGHTVRLPNEFNVHDVLSVRWLRDPNEQMVTVWSIGFFETHFFNVITRPRPGMDVGPVWNASQHRWPGPAIGVASAP